MFVYWEECSFTSKQKKVGTKNNSENQKIYPESKYLEHSHGYFRHKTVEFKTFVTFQELI